MSTADVYLAVALGAVLVAVGWLAWEASRRRAAERRAADRLAALQAEVAGLTEEVLELRAELTTVREAIRRLAVPSRPGEEVPLITGIAERDDVDVGAGRIASVTLAGPLMKAAALSSGVRHALHEEQRMRISYAMRKELKRQRKMRRRRRTERSRSEGWVP